jgi:uncharacterized protein (TIGR00288 family)
LTPWWLRPTAEGASNDEKEEKKDRPHEKAAHTTPEPPSPEPPAPVAPESVALAPEPLKETSPSLEAEPAWRHEPVPVPETPAPSVWLPREPEPLPLQEPPMEVHDEDDEDEEELPVQAEGAEPSEAAQEEAKAEARRRRPRRSRGRRKEGRATAPAAGPAEEEEDEALAEEPAMPVIEEPAPTPPRRAALTSLPSPSPRVARESYVIPASDIESVAREIIISVPERQRIADERKIAMFCDLENIALGVRDSEVGKFDIELILERLLEKGKIIVKKAYADWERYSEYKRPFHESAIELIDIPQKYYSGKNSADIKMVVDAMDLSYSKEHLDTFVILSGDSDFSPLVSKLKENNKYVIGIGVKNSSSSLLIDNCDEFLYYEDVWRDTQQGPKLDGLNKKTAEAFSLMVDAIQALTRENKDVLWGSMIKQTMQRKKPSFNEGYYGYASFSELLEDAERKNIIRLKKDQRSGTYIVTGFAKGSEAPASTGRR